jgi:hypothetical protein
MRQLDFVPHRGAVQPDIRGRRISKTISMVRLNECCFFISDRSSIDRDLPYAFIRHFPFRRARLRRRPVFRYCASAPHWAYPVFEVFWSSGQMRDARLGARAAFRPRSFESAQGIPLGHRSRIRMKLLGDGQSRRLCNSAIPAGLQCSKSARDGRLTSDWHCERAECSDGHVGRGCSDDTCEVLRRSSAPGHATLISEVIRPTDSLSVGQPPVFLSRESRHRMELICVKTVVS